MKLWHLEARTDLPEDDDPWGNPIGTNLALVVRASTEESARQLAQESAGDEAGGAYIEDGNRAGPCSPWLDARYSTCTELSADGDEKVILIDCRDI